LFSPLCRRALDNVAVWSFCAIRAGATTGISAGSPTGAPVCTIVNDTSQATGISTRSPRVALRRSVGVAGADRSRRTVPAHPVSGSLGQLGRGCLAALQHLVDQAVVLGLLGRQDLVSLDVLADLLQLGRAVPGDRGLQPLPHPHHLVGVDLRSE